MKIKKEEFIKMYYEMSIKDMCDKLRVSQPYLYKVINELKIPKKKKPRRKMNKIEIV